MDIFVARQPILDGEKQIFGYELLYRSSRENVYPGAEEVLASGEVMVNSFSIIGLGKLTGGEKAFVNFPRQLIEQQVATLFPEDLLVIEMAGESAPGDDFLASCQELKALGYEIGLDDFSAGECARELLLLADYVKVDVQKYSPECLGGMLQDYRQPGQMWVGLKIERDEDFQRARELGFNLFQGFFFSRPHLVPGKGLSGLRANYLELLREASRPRLDFDRVEMLIKQDVSLAYKLLKYINSAFFGFRTEINSIRQTLVLLGEKEIKKWIILFASLHFRGSQPSGLMVLALTRAYFCEKMGEVTKLAHRAPDLFFLGLFSLMDAILEEPLAAILEELPIKEDIKATLLGRGSEMKPVYDLVLALEEGDSEMVEQVARAQGWEGETVMKAHLQAIEDAREVTEMAAQVE